ncbi:hypothetical protein LU293_06760 [Moraxella nasovis]|uniref:hypothetical protein n=1 Tax=Moraxella nasovis TaxID=2904121 RepID=UPI001F5FFD96|nr:hypothetical protein [Moraxella nasovis]UNU72804.1 hypothetical protein LU293_06760 [Moraxella nasovis]
MSQICIKSMGFWQMAQLFNLAIQSRQIGGFIYLNSMNICLTNPQYHIAIHICLLQLDLLDGDEMMAFVHDLMNLGFYDDLMLDILDDDLVKIEIRELLLTICKNLNFYKFDDDELILIYTLDILLLIFTLPTNFMLFDDYYIWDYFGVGLENNKCHHELIEPIYNFYYEIEYCHDKPKNHHVYSFVQYCQDWLNRHETQICQILTPFTKIQTL